MELDRTWIASRIPHRDRMCLLDRVLEWDDAHVVCRATSHRDIDNPLRAHGRLGAACGIEYAAQAMAVHGALLVGDGLPPRMGYLTSVREVELRVPRLDQVAADLDVEAQRLSGDENNIAYRFFVRAGQQELLCGRAIVVLDAERTPRCRRGGNT
jgi:predicted hotdog family 3-hydroxylacyl-ACP dehydratase